MKKEKIKNLMILILMLLLGVFAWISLSNNDSYQEQVSLVEALNDEIKIWKDKDSATHAKIQIIETAKAKDFVAMEIMDSTVKNLQQTVSEFSKYLKKQGSVTNITNVTEVYNSAGTVVSKDSTGNAVYKSNFNLDNWVLGDIVATKDSTKLNLKYFSDYSIVLGQEKDGLFKKKPFVEIIDRNPYSSKHKVRTYQVSQPPVKRFGIGPYVGYGVGVDLKLHTTVGVGLQFNLIRF